MKRAFFSIIRGLSMLGLLALVPALITSRWHPEAWLVDAGEPREGELDAGDERLMDPEKVIRVVVDSGKEHSDGGIVMGEADWDVSLEKLFSRWSPEKLVVVSGRRGDAKPYEVAGRLRALGIERVVVLRN